MSLNQIKTIKLKKNLNPKGDILKYLTKNNKYLKSFGEIYFTEIKKNKVKGWNYHKKCWCLLSVPLGKVQFTFAKKIESKKRSIIIGKKKYCMIVVPPGFWFKFKSLEKISLVVNTIDKIHNKNETLKIPIK
tara:strand:- start:492 stop:887 length:396 start_codon:yes stop_codon:yes gene_type:complete